MTTIYAGLRPSKNGGAGGLFRRDGDGGAWERTLDQPTQAITIDPRRPDIVHAATADGPYRSTDSGRTWQRAGLPDRGVQIWSIAFDPADPRTVYAGASPVGVYRSEDGGETFRRLPDPNLPERVNMGFACRVMRIASHPRRRGELYAALEVGGAMRSSDGGESWQDCGENLAQLARLPHLKSRIVSDSEAEGMLDGHAIATTPAEPDRVFLALRMGLFCSDDAGRTWQDMEVGKVSPHTYGRDLRVSPHDPAVIYACLSPAFTSGTGSLWRSTDAGRSWARFDSTTPHDTAMSLALHPEDARQVYFAAKTGEVFGTRDGGESWAELRLPSGSGDVFALACG
jgi:photosystem II stability/assembly factor-like uncharacterized protein